MDVKVILNLFLVIEPRPHLSDHRTAKPISIGAGCHESWLAASDLWPHITSLLEYK